MKPAPKPEKKAKAPRRGLARSKRRIARISHRHAGGEKFWKGQCRAIALLQRGICAEHFIKEPLDAAHIEGLGRRVPGGRYNATHRLNQLPNLIGLCRRAHEWFDSHPMGWRIHYGAHLKARIRHA